MFKDTDHILYKFLSAEFSNIQHLVDDRSLPQREGACEPLYGQVEVSQFEGKFRNKRVLFYLTKLKTSSFIQLVGNQEIVK